MLESYLKIGWRNLLRSKVHSFINIIGLSIGIASCVLISIYIKDELSYDRYHEHATRIHRVVSESAKMPAALGPALVSTSPHLVENAARLWPLFSPAKMRHEDVVFVENGVVFADSSVFSLFSWPLLKGNPSKALASKNSIVLTRSMAEKYYGEKDPVGAQMKFWGNDLTVTGVMEDLPHNSHLQFDFLVSFSTLQLVMGDNLNENWEMPVFYTYVLPSREASLDQIKSTVHDLIKRSSSHPPATIALQSLPAIHLHSKLEGEFSPGSNTTYLYVLGTAAIFILLLASINFTNLNTARASTRVKEVGMRKVLGAVKGQLVQQFFGESLITCFVALSFAIIMVSLVMPAFNQFTGKAIELNEALDLPFVAGGLLLMLLIGFFSGSYPALFLARMKPISNLKSLGGQRSSTLFVRKGLIVLQFLVSTFFVSSMIVVMLQLNYLQRKDLGFDQEQIIVLDGDGFPQLKNALAGISGVEQVSGVPQVFPALLPMSSFRIDGLPDSSGQMTRYGVTPGFIETMGIEVIAGKAFRENSQQDEEEAFVLNEAALKELGWSAREAIGKSFSMFVPPVNGGAEVWREGYITGVVADFHFEALYNKVKPIVLYPSNDMNLTLVRIQMNDAVISSIREVWAKVNPEAPFNYYFLDDRIQHRYEAELKLGALIGTATGLAVIIAALGLLGLVSFAASQRTKEIGIRKVLGASSTQIVTLLSADLMKLVGVAALLSFPLAYYAANEWLTNFAYHVELSWLIFAGAGFFTLFVAFLTVVVQSLQAALLRPVESLQSE